MLSIVILLSILEKDKEIMPQNIFMSEFYAIVYSLHPGMCFKAVWSSGCEGALI